MPAPGIPSDWSDLTDYINNLKVGCSCHSERWRPRRRPRAWNRGICDNFLFERMFTRFPAHRSSQEGTEDLPSELGVWKKMFLQSCQSVLPDNKVGITEQSQEGVFLAGPSVTKLFVGNHRIHGQAKIAFSCSDQGRTLEKIKTTTNAYLPSMKNFTFQRRSKKMLLHQRVVWDQALHWGEKEKKNRCGRKKKR